MDLMYPESREIGALIKVVSNAMLVMNRDYIVNGTHS